MVLPTGVTGFWHQSTTSLATIDQKAFKSLCAHATQRVHGTLKDTTDATHIQCSFYMQNITYKTKTFSILCNKYVPFVALANHTPNANDIATGAIFVDEPELMQALNQSPWRVLTTDLLLLRPEQLDMSQLSSVELDQITYWQPQSCAAIVYNYWD